MWRRERSSGLTGPLYPSVPEENGLPTVTAAIQTCKHLDSKLTQIGGSDALKNSETSQYEAQLRLHEIFQGLRERHREGGERRENMSVGISGKDKAKMLRVGPGSSRRHPSP